MIRVGIIGYGKMGQVRREAIDSTGYGRVIAIADPGQGPVEGVDWMSDPHALLARRDVDAVFVCTPNHLNQPLTAAALSHGKHVFCEKPPAFTAAEVEEIVTIERRSGLTLMYGFNHRHHDSLIHARQLVRSGTYGRVLWMRGRYGKSVDANFYETWRSKRELAGGGILIDQGIHMLDLFLMLAGDFDEVHAFVSNIYWNLNVEDNVFVILKSSDGLVASLHSTMTQWRHLFSFEVFLEKGYIVANGLLTPSGTYGEEVLTVAKNRTIAPAAMWSDEERTTYEVDNSWRAEVKHFFEAIQAGHPVTIGTSSDALRVMRLVDRIYEQSQPSERARSLPTPSFPVDVTIR